MSGISQLVIYAVCRVETTFATSAAPLVEKTKQGTGFFVAIGGGRRAFVLNRHSVDPKMAHGVPEGHSLQRIAIELRRFRDLNTPDVKAERETRFFEVTNLRTALSVHDNADCAALISPTFRGPLDDFNPIAIKLSDLANEDYLGRHAKIMDLASFIGYPSNPPLWDQVFTLPIARLCSLASLPNRNFSNEAIPTTAVGLVSGLSFGGSSGSPLWIHGKPGIAAKIIGLMSGHHLTREESDLHHTGISWFTRSPAIHELLVTEIRDDQPGDHTEVRVTEAE